MAHVPNAGQDAIVGAPWNAFNRDSGASSGCFTGATTYVLSNATPNSPTPTGTLWNWDTSARGPALNDSSNATYQEFDATNPCRDATGSNFSLCTNLPPVGAVNATNPDPTRLNGGGAAGGYNVTLGQAWNVSKLSIVWQQHFPTGAPADLCLIFFGTTFDGKTVFMGGIPSNHVLNTYLFANLTLNWNITKLTMVPWVNNGFGFFEVYDLHLYALKTTPVAPTNVNVVAVPKTDGTGACVDLSWTASDSTAAAAATGYSIFQKQDGSGPATSPMNLSVYSYVGHVNGTSSSRCGLASGAAMHYRIVPTNTNGEGDASADATNTTVAGMPSYVNAVPSNTTVVKVNWTIDQFIKKSTGYSIFYKVSPEGVVAWPLNSSGYSYFGHVDDPTYQVNVTSLSTSTNYCFRVESTNASANGEGDVGTTAACATTGNITLPPVLSGNFVPCQTFALSWTQPIGSIDGYRIDQSTPYLPFVNRSFFVPPDGNFTLRELNVSFPQISGELDYAAFAHSPAGGYSASSNVVNFTPQKVSTIGDCGLQWGGTGASDFATQAGISVSAAQVMVSIFLIVMGAGIGLVAMGNGAGVVGGVGAGMLLSLALGLVPSWAVMFALVVGAALGIVGAMLSVGQRKLQRGGLGR